jgi:hypothetical protein
MFWCDFSVVVCTYAALAQLSPSLTRSLSFTTESRPHEAIEDRITEDLIVSTDGVPVRLDVSVGLAAIDGHQIPTLGLIGLSCRIRRECRNHQGGFAVNVTRGSVIQSQQSVISCFTLQLSDVNLHR